MFENRRHAGEVLARRLREYADHPDVVVLALPRGGVPVAYEVARALHAPLDVFLVRKLGVPGEEELAMGAIASGGVKVVNQDVVAAMPIRPGAMEEAVAREGRVLEAREREYRGDHPAVPLEGKTVLLIDDGLATGTSMRAAVQGLKGHRPSHIIVATPVASSRGCCELGDDVEEIVCVVSPDPFYSVGQWYEDFSQTSDQEVRALLEQARRWEPREVAPPAP